MASLHLEVDLRAVEGAVARVERERRCRASRARERSVASARSQVSAVPTAFAGRVESSTCDLVEAEDAVDLADAIPTTLITSDSIWSSVQKMWASSWQNVRTRVRPVMTPLRS